MVPKKIFKMKLINPDGHVKLNKLKIGISWDRGNTLEIHVHMDLHQSLQTCLRGKGGQGSVNIYIDNLSEPKS